MIRQKRALLSLTVATALLGLLGGCSTSPEVHYFTLSAAPRTAPSAATPITGGLAIGTLTLPRILDQPEIARRVGSNQMDYAEYDRWATSLDDLVRHALAEDISAELGIPVLPMSNVAGGDTGQMLQLNVDRFEADADGAVSLTASWHFAGANEQSYNSAGGRADITCPAHGRSAAEIASTMSVALGVLGNRIVETMQAQTVPLPVTSQRGLCS